MSDRLWVVEVMTELVVEASDAEAAEEYVTSRLPLLLSGEDIEVSARPAMKGHAGKNLLALPCGWELIAIPYGSDGKTIGEILERDREDDNGS